MDSYGVLSRRVLSSLSERILESIAIDGFYILESVVPVAEICELKAALTVLAQTQESEFSQEQLRSIGELDLVRAPLTYDERFLSVAASSLVMPLIRALLGDFVVLNLQNGIIVRSGIKHLQASWHRDLPYQEWVCTKPLAVNALWCLDEFSSVTGGTRVLPGSHRLECMPSEDYLKLHEFSIEASAGSIVLFDAMLYHRSGENSSGKERMGINNMYSRPMLKQQIDLPRAFGHKYQNSPEFSQFLGYSSSVPESVVQFRSRRLQRLTSM